MHTAHDEMHTGATHSSSKRHTDRYVPSQGIVHTFSAVVVMATVALYAAAGAQSFAEVSPDAKADQIVSAATP